MNYEMYGKLDKVRKIIDPVLCNELEDCLDKLQDYQNKDNSGYLREFEARIGDIVYYVQDGFSVIECKVVEITQKENQHLKYMLSPTEVKQVNNYECIGENFNNTVFYSREEAEEYLNEQLDEEYGVDNIDDTVTEELCSTEEPKIAKLSSFLTDKFTESTELELHYRQLQLSEIQSLHLGKKEAFAEALRFMNEMD